MAKCPTTATQSLCCWIDSSSLSWCYCAPTRCDNPLSGQTAPRPTYDLIWNGIHSRIYVCPQPRWLEWQGSSDCRFLCTRESSPPHLDLWDHEQLAESTRAQGAQSTGQPRICDPCGVSLIPTRCPKFHVSIGDISGHRRYNPTATDNDLVLLLPTIIPYIMPYSEFIQDPSLVRRADVPTTLVSRNDRIERTRGRGQSYESGNTRFQSHECHLGEHTPKRASRVYIGVGIGISSAIWGEDGVSRSCRDGRTMACRSAVR